jgi:hypothetical protein
MKTTRQAENNGVDLFIGALLFIGLTFFFCIELTLILTKERPFHLLWIACLLTSALTGYFLANKFSVDVANKIRRGGFGLIIAGSAMYLQYNHLPLSIASVTLGRTTCASSLLLRQFLPYHQEKTTKAYVAPQLHAQTINFKLPNIIRERNRPFKVYFGRDQNSYDIQKISFGTQVLWLPIPLATYRGAKILQIAGTEKTINKLELVDNTLKLASKIHSRPTLNIISNKNFIYQNITARQIYTVKLLWLFLCAGSSGIILWSLKPNRLKRPKNKLVWIKYLTE